MQVQQQACADIRGFILIPMFTELMYGGSTAKIGLKLVTRLVPLWFAASRAEEVVESAAVARELHLGPCVFKLESDVVLGLYARDQRL